jgi:hypothetical protein
MPNVRTTLRLGIVTFVLALVLAATVLYSPNPVTTFFTSFRPTKPALPGPGQPCQALKSALQKSATGAYTTSCAVACNDNSFINNPVDGPDQHDLYAYCCREGETLLFPNGVATCSSK